MKLSNPSNLKTILENYRNLSHTQRDSGTLFEDLMVVYFKHEPKFKEQYRTIMPYARWVDFYGHELGIESKKDTGIDLVATTFTGEHHAIQCKNYAPSHKMAKSDIDSFMSASGKTHFSYRIVVSTVTDWTDNAIEMVQHQHPPVSTISLSELEQSAVDWHKYYQENKVEKDCSLDREEKQMNRIEFLEELYRLLNKPLDKHTRDFRELVFSKSKTGSILIFEIIGTPNKLSIITDINFSESNKDDWVLKQKPLLVNYKPVNKNKIKILNLIYKYIEENKA